VAERAAKAGAAQAQKAGGRGTVKGAKGGKEAASSKGGLANKEEGASKKISGYILFCSEQRPVGCRSVGNNNNNKV
jgi:hypothetical protein